MEIGRLCIKLAGRDAGRICVIVDNLEGNFVLIDGNVRRRKCNILHLEPLDKAIKIKKGASHSDVASEFKKLKIEVWSTKPKKEKPQKPAVKRKPANPEKKQKTKKPAEEQKKEPKKDQRDLMAAYFAPNVQGSLLSQK